MPDPEKDPSTEVTADLTNPGDFILEAISLGMESDDGQYSRWSHSITEKLGFFLLVMVEYQDSLPDQLRAAYPEALRRYYLQLPSWMRYDVSVLLDKHTDTLPADVLEVVKSHTYSSR